MPMPVALHAKFNPTFPEEFNWGLIDGQTLTDVAERICREIKSDMRGTSRLRVPGLRLALNCIAEVALIHVH